MRMRYDAKLYSLKAIRKGIRDYGEIAEMSVGRGDGGYYEVAVKKLSDPALEDRLEDEFGNYVLHHTVEEKKNW